VLQNVKQPCRVANRKSPDTKNRVSPISIELTRKAKSLKITTVQELDCQFDADKGGG
jgi:hypothetical protein